MENITQTEEKILKAATGVFLQKGKDGARMQEIAEASGINKAMLHYYFRSKEQLYQKVLTQELRLFFSTLIDSIPETEDLREFLQGFIYTYIDHLSGNQQVIRFLTWEIGEGIPIAKAIFQELFDNHSKFPPAQRFFRLVNQGIEKKEVRELDPQHLILSVIGSSIFVFLAAPIIQIIFPDVNVKDTSFIEKRKEEIFNLIWNGIKS